MAKKDQNNAERNVAVLTAAYQAWCAASAFRQNRRRNKNFTYGNQWGDLLRTTDGRTLTEYEYMIQQGREPITNNLMRQLVKTVVGRFRAQQRERKLDSRLADVASQQWLDEVDSRALEEFLISGCCVQRVDVECGLCVQSARVDNVPFGSFFINAITDARASDCEIVGQIHDLSVADLLRRVSGGNRKKAAAVRALYADCPDERMANFTAAIGADSQQGCDFWRAKPGKCRAIEVWTLESREVLVCHDSTTAELFTVPFDQASAYRGKKGLATRWDIAKVWHCRWFSPMGDLLTEFDSPYSHASHPFVVKMYPLTDGEIHAFVEDVIDQQKYVNRLITMVDHIMAAAAKGVLLFPQDALPDGFTWGDVRKVWSSCNGVLPFSTRYGSAKPEQVTGEGSNAGAYEMIALQMKLFDEISGVNGALQGRNANSLTGAGLYEQQAANSALSLTDVYATFESFQSMRNAKILEL